MLCRHIQMLKYALKHYNVHQENNVQLITLYIKI